MTTSQLNGDTSGESPPFPHWFDEPVKALRSATGKVRKKGAFQ